MDKPTGSFDKGVSRVKPGISGLTRSSSILLVDHDEVLTNVTPLAYALKFRPAFDYEPHGEVLALLRQHGAEE